MIFSFKARGDKLLKFNNQGHVSVRSVWIKRNKYGLHINTNANVHQLLLYMVGFIVYRTFRWFLGIVWLTMDRSRTRFPGLFQLETVTVVFMLLHEFLTGSWLLLVPGLALHCLRPST